MGGGPFRATNAGLRPRPACTALKKIATSPEVHLFVGLPSAVSVVFFSGWIVTKKISKKFLKNC
jgi:hypothetical protein